MTDQELCNIVAKLFPSQQWQQGLISELGAFEIRERQSPARMLEDFIRIWEPSPELWTIRLFPDPVASF